MSLLWLLDNPLGLVLGTQVLEIIIKKENKMKA